MADEFNEKLCDTKHKALEDAIAACNKLQDSRFEAAKEALTLRTEEINAKFVTYNHLREEVINDRQMMLPRGEYMIQHEALRDDITEVKTALGKLADRILTIEARAGVIAGIIAVAMTLLGHLWK